MVLKMNPTHRRGWWPLAFVAIVLISLGILSIPWRGHRPDEPPRLTLAGGSAGWAQAASRKTRIDKTDDDVTRMISPLLMAHRSTWAARKIAIMHHSREL